MDQEEIDLGDPVAEADDEKDENDSPNANGRGDSVGEVNNEEDKREDIPRANGRGDSVGEVNNEEDKGEDIPRANGPGDPVGEVAVVDDNAGDHPCDKPKVQFPKDLDGVSWMIAVFVVGVPSILRNRIIANSDIYPNRFSEYLDKNVAILREMLPEIFYQDLFSGSYNQDLLSLECRPLWYILQSIPELRMRFGEEELLTIQSLIHDCLPDLYGHVKKLLPKNLEAPKQLERQIWQLVSSFDEAQALKTAAEYASPDTKGFIDALENDKMFMSEYCKRIEKQVGAARKMDSDSLRAMRTNATKALCTSSQFYKYNREVLKTELQRISECTSCKVLMKELISLPCLHSFCASCLKYAFNPVTKLIICPTCETPIKVDSEEAILKLPKNFVASAFLYCLQHCLSCNGTCDLCIAPPEALCLHCPQVVCKNHSAGLYHSQGTHLILSLEKITLEPLKLKRLLSRFCSQHKKPPACYCNNCHIPLCAEPECLRSHTIHGKIVSILEISENRRQSIKCLNGEVDKKLQKFEHRIGEAQHCQTSLAEMQGNILESVNHYFDEMQSLIEEKRSNFIGEVERVGTECMAKNEQTIDALNVWVKQARLMQSEYSTMRSSGDEGPPFAELTTAQSAYNRLLWDGVNGAGITDWKAISYPEANLRSLLQRVSSLSPEFAALSLQPHWDQIIKQVGIRHFYVHGNYVYLVKKTMLSGHAVVIYDLRKVADGGYTPQTLTEGGIQGLHAVSVTNNGTILVVEEAHNSLEIPTMRVTRTAYLRLYSAATKQRNGVVPLKHLNQPHKGILVKIEGSNVYISDGTCICEYEESKWDELVRKFNFHNMVDVTDFVPFTAQKDIMFVTDKTKHNMFIFNSRSHVMKTIGGEGATPGAFLRPTGISRDYYGHIAVADSGNGRIQIFDIQGKFIKMIPFPAPIKAEAQQNLQSRAILQFHGDYLYLTEQHADTLWRLKYI